MNFCALFGHNLAPRSFFSITTRAKMIRPNSSESVAQPQIKLKRRDSERPNSLVVACQLSPPSCQTAVCLAGVVVQAAVRSLVKPVGDASLRQTDRTLLV